ncbi:hypothetical protein O181_038548 [Austropuccinia psidii MF-1]|uniref:ELYS-like domain-containing protein n=1 Tax=Austropuccinia psidii MF-1 TaxID=1389203 RepID=A0A9Q3HB41_9BASI|nr:hypothetical protein [Austropuccinia psidii MF-1]
MESVCRRLEPYECDGSHWKTPYSKLEIGHGLLISSSRPQIVIVPSQSPRSLMMEQSIFSLFTTKDWPFRPSTNGLNHHENQVDLTQDVHSTPDKSFPSNQLRSREEMVHGLLFFDRLMLLGSISNYKELFPPSHPSRLRQLLDSIDGSPFDLLKKNCLVYYLLKEYGDARETKFAIDRLIPSHFTLSLDGLWALDHSQWQVAIRCFSDPVLTPDFLPEIIHALATLPPIRSRSEYLLRFYHLAQPTLDLPSTEFVIRAMSIGGHVRSAWALQRSYSRPERDRLIQNIFEACFGLNEFQKPLAESLEILLGFPFDELEHSIISRFALSAPHLLPDPHFMVVVHFYLSLLISEARYIEAIRFERELSESAQLASDPDIDRLIRGIADMLPEVQRNMLELEFDQQHPILSQNLPAESANHQPDNMDMSASYDLCSLAWDPPPSPPPMPLPNSLAEARSQQELRHQPKPSTPKTTLPLSASPFFRRTAPRVPLQEPKDSQKTLLKALALHSHQMSISNSSDTNQASQSDSADLATQSGRTPRFTHFVGPSRLPANFTPPSQPKAHPQSFARPSVPTAGSPFHRAANPKAEKTAPSHEERWPTRIYFTPHRPPQKKAEVKVPAKINPVNQPRGRLIKPIGSDSSEEPTPPPAIKQRFEGVVVPRGTSRGIKSPPKKLAKVIKRNHEVRPMQPKKVLPGGLEIDEDMLDATENDSSEIPISTEKNKPTTSARKKVRESEPPVPMTPRRSTRLHFSTPKKGTVTVPDDLIEEGDDDRRGEAPPTETRRSGKSRARKKLGHK